ncbi:putative permease of ABC transporter [Nostocoides japonicum T1-X7]|uniref:Putative permease of ABC transporter n=1 Tax=Nostocoides japonicum T1-X7 TaxID=1194083 RepID=A0A077LYM6_9MICO|nr:ABC transporter permease subunit [Tetrasphaera japonica]CCH78726.1 putative permease of ABC transporter [Tetrasphaera japonica T1-X7]
MSSGQRARFRRKQAILRRVVVTVVMIFFLVPLYAMFDYTTRDLASGGRSMRTWKTLLDFGKVSEQYPDLRTGFIASVLLAVLTVAIMLVLLVPTMTWVRLRLPGLSRIVEFICLLPLTVPAIVLVVGLTPIYAWVTYLLGGATVWLCFAYVILVLPYAYRALDAGLRAIDVRTLSEAARSLGASWLTVMWRIVLPNLRTAVLSASFLAVALTLGEFTIANLFSRTNLQVAMYLLGKSDAQISVAVGLLALVFAFVVLFAMSFVGSGRAGTSAFARLRHHRKETA